MPGRSAVATPGGLVAEVRVVRVGAVAVDALALLREVDTHVDGVPPTVVEAAPAHHITSDVHHIAGSSVLMHARVVDGWPTEIGRRIRRRSDRRRTNECSEHEQEACAHCFQLVLHILSSRIEST